MICDVGLCLVVIVDAQVCGGSLITGSGGGGGRSVVGGMVGRWDGFNDPLVWWIGAASVAVV